MSSFKSVQFEDQGNADQEILLPWKWTGEQLHVKDNGQIYRYEIRDHRVFLLPDSRSKANQFVTRVADEIRKWLEVHRHSMQIEGKVAFNIQSRTFAVIEKKKPMNFIRASHLFKLWLCQTVLFPLPKEKQILSHRLKCRMSLIKTCLRSLPKLWGICLAILLSEISM